MVRTIVIAITLGLASAHSLAQAKPIFAGKWVIKGERTSGTSARINPFCGSQVMSIGQDSKTLQVACSVPPNRSDYSLTGATTSVSIGETKGTAKAAWESNRLVLTITVAGRSKPLNRTMYLDGFYLVVEHSDGSTDKEEKVVFEKS